LWQYGTDTIIGIADPVDVSREKESTVSTGVLVGFHTQGDSDAVNIAAEYAAAGVKIPIMLADEDGGKAIDTQNTVKVRVTRLQFLEEGPDADFEGGGSGRLGWSEEKKLRYLAGIEYMLTVRLGIGELNAATHLQLGCNEWEAQTIEEWIATLNLMLRVVEKVKEISDRLMATKGLIHPLRLMLPIFNAGSPKSWDMYVVIAEHPIWPRMAELGYAIGEHEGIRFGDPFDYLHGVPVSEGAPLPPDGGCLNFRIDTLLMLLWQKGIRIAYATLEWYDGRYLRDNDVDNQLEKRVDNLIDLDRHLATMGGPWHVLHLGTCTYQLAPNPENKWHQQDFTPIWKHPRWKAYCISVKDRINGDTTMADIATARAQIAAARASLDKAEAALADNWWDKLPTGVFATPIVYAAQPDPGYFIYGPDGQQLLTGSPAHPIKRTNGGTLLERQGGLFRVTATPPLAGLPNWWIKAAELTVHPS
jgi:hypothetical protein